MTVPALGMLPGIVQGKERSLGFGRGAGRGRGSAARLARLLLQRGSDELFSACVTNGPFIMSGNSASAGTCPRAPSVRPGSADWVVPGVTQPRVTRAFIPLGLGGTRHGNHSAPLPPVREQRFGGGHPLWGPGGALP